MVKATLRKPTTTKPTVVIDPPVATGPATTSTVDVEATVTDLADAVESTPAEEKAYIDSKQPGAAEESQLPARRTGTTAVARPAMHFEGEGLEGDWNEEDLKFPTLKLVQGNGPLSKEWNVGTLLFDDVELLPPPDLKKGSDGNPRLRFVPILLSASYRESLSEEDMKAGMTPRTAKTREEVAELDGTTRWGTPDDPKAKPANYFQKTARCLILVELPEGSDHPGFALELDGKLWAVAVYYAAGGAFTNFAKIIFNASRASLLVPVLGEDGKPQKSEKGYVIKKPMLWKNVWSVQWAPKENQSGFAPWTPSVRLHAKEETGPDLRAFAESLAGGRESSDAA